MDIQQLQDAEPTTDVGIRLATPDDCGASRKTNDVLLWSDNEDHREHPGNRRFQEIIQRQSDCSNRLERPIVALEILEQWRKQDPPGRFLQFDKTTRLWNDIGDKKARERISRALRTRNSGTMESVSDREIETGTQTREEITHDPTSTVQDQANERPSGINGKHDERGGIVETSHIARRVSTKINFARKGKLHGRSKEQQELLNMYHRLKDPSLSMDFILVSGEAGCGKSALASSLRSTVIEDCGFFVQGKFFRDRESVEPAAAFIAALEELANQMLQLEEETLHMYSESLRGALDDEDVLLTSVIPAFESILAPRQEIVTSNVGGAGHGAQAVRRVEYVFRRLLRAVASPEHPLVFVLDDLHCASDAAMDLLLSLVKDLANSARVLFVVTYRNDDSADTRSVKEILDLFHTNEFRLHHIQLRNLDLDSVRCMLADSLSLEMEKTTTLSELLFSRTRGNVLFLLQLLRDLQEDELVHFDEKTSQWICDNHMISVHVDWETIHDLFRAKLVELPTDLQNVLTAASCLGLRINKGFMELIFSGGVHSQLQIAVTKALVVSDETRGEYAFSHDVIQQAAYSLIPAESRAGFHLRIGRKLWRKLTLEDLDTFIFVVLGQLMIGIHQVTDQDEKVAIASLCLRAGEKAIGASGFQAASVYLRFGSSLVGSQGWRHDYDLILRLHNAAAEVCYCTAQFDEVSRLVDEVLLNARSFEDTLQARATRVYALGSIGRLPEAIDYGLDTLKNLGEIIPANPSILQGLVAVWRTKRMLRGRSDEDLLRLPLMNDPQKLASMQILNLIFLYTLYGRQSLVPLVVTRMVRLTICHGISVISCVGFASYGMYLSGSGKNIEEGYRYGKLALRLYDQFNTDAWLCRLSVAYYGCIGPWNKPLKRILEPLKQAYRVGLASGDMEYAVLNASLYCWNCRESLPLSILEREIKALTERMEFLGQVTAARQIKPLWPLIHNFTGRAHGSPTVLTGEIMNQDAILAESRESNLSLLLWTRFQAMIASYLFGDYDSAEEYSRGSEKLFKNAYGAMDASCVLFYESMSLLAQAQKGQRRHLRVVRRRLKLLQHWAKHSPMNLLGRQFMIEAELAVATGDHLSAVSKYISSILHSREGGLLVPEALANERLGKQYLLLGDEEAAAPFLKEALRLYDAWGGTTKVQHLKNELPVGLLP